jgi:hypothetical protein
MPTVGDVGLVDGLGVVNTCAGEFLIGWFRPVGR